MAIGLIEVGSLSAFMQKKNLKNDLFYDFFSLCAEQ